MPSTKDMFLNLTGTALEAFNHAVQHKAVFVDEKTMHERIDICVACPQYITGSIGPDRCGVCGCGMKIKVRLAVASCPLKKWDRTVPTL